MRRFSMKMATRVLLVIVAADVLLLVLTQILPETRSANWLVGIPWWIINFPGFPLVRFLDSSEFVVAFVGVPLVSALLWSTVLGYVLGERNVS